MHHDHGYVYTALLKFENPLLVMSGSEALEVGRCMVRGRVRFHTTNTPQARGASSWREFSSRPAFLEDKDSRRSVSGAFLRAVRKRTRAMLMVCMCLYNIQ